MIKFVEVKKITDFNPLHNKTSTRYELTEVWVNPATILQIKGDSVMKYNLAQGYLPEQLDERQQFSCIQYGTGNNVTALTVVGDPEAITEKIHRSSARVLLKG